jgi:hypothetical protein
LWRRSGNKRVWIARALGRRRDRLVGGRCSRFGEIFDRHFAEIDRYLARRAWRQRHRDRRRRDRSSRRRGLSPPNEILHTKIAGSDHLRMLDQILSLVQDELLAPLSAAERSQLIRLLSRLLEYHAQR